MLKTIEINREHVNAVAEIKRLRLREHREKTGLTIVEGYPEIARAVKADIPVKVIYICPQIFQYHTHEFDQYPIVEVPHDVYIQMAFAKEGLKGILAICRPFQYTLEDIKLSKSPFIVVLEKVEKPGNIGAVIRTCDGAGADGVIICDGKTDVYNHNIVRSSIGTVFHLKTVSASAEEILAFLKKNRITIYVASSHAKAYYTQCDLSKPSAFILGSEHEGVSQFWLDHADERIKIPMMGESKCLNVASSASILAYETLRQRSTK